MQISRRNASLVRALAVATFTAWALSVSSLFAPTISYSQAERSSENTADVVVFGATPAGVMAAVAAARAAQQVVLVEPTAYVGGMMSGGLTRTDTGPRGPEVFGGLTEEFFRRVREIEAGRGACMDPCESSYDFEPQVAERVFEEMLDESGVRLLRAVGLAGVEEIGNRIVRLVTTRGTLEAAVYVDASYEGDLMALAGVAYRIGREPLVHATPNDMGGLALQEDHAGIQAFQLPLGVLVDPYRVPGDPSSGTLNFIDPRPEPLPELGEGDERVMAYNYRLCVTDDPTNRIPFERPMGYDPSDVEALARLAEAAASADVDFVRSMFNVNPTARSVHDPSYYKYDLNGGFSLSTDLIGDDLNQAFAEASSGDRMRIERTYRKYIQSLLYAWRTDRRFGALNERVAEFGYCADEFADRGHWPHQLYVRVGRRMIGEYTMNENDLLQNGRREPISDPVAFGSYAMGTHAHRHFAAPREWPNGERKDAIVLGGIVIVRIPENEPYPISYRALTPRREEAGNLLNPVTLSATNLAYSSIRMEPTYMMLGEAAGTAAALSVETDADVQEIDYRVLRRRLSD